MEVACAACDQTVSLREIETTTEFVGDSFQTSYLCPNCNSELPREDVVASG